MRVSHASVLESAVKRVCNYWHLLQYHSNKYRNIGIVQTHKSELITRK